MAERPRQVAQQAGGVRNDGRAQHPHVQFADRRGGQQAGIVMQAGNPHMPGGAGDDQRSDRRFGRQQLYTVYLTEAAAAQGQGRLGLRSPCVL